MRAGALPEWFLRDEPPPSRTGEWITLALVLAGVLGLLALASPVLALVVGGLLGGWVLLWLTIHVAGRATLRPFLRELREGNTRYSWYDAEGLLREEREIVRMRRDLMKALARDARRHQPVRRSRG